MSQSEARLRPAGDVDYCPYRTEEYDLPDIMDLVDQELSEPWALSICHRGRMLIVFPIGITVRTVDTSLGRIDS